MRAPYNIVIFIAIVLFHVCSAQASPLKARWQPGQITLWNKTILEGDVSYNWLAEMIMIRQSDGHLYTFSAGQASQFGWFDSTDHKYRTFQSFSVPVAKDRSVPAFFELCTDGSLLVVRRLRRSHGLWKRAFGHPANFADQPVMTQNPDQFDYFVHDAGQLLALDRFYTDIYVPLMTGYDRQLQEYIKVHNLNFRSLVGRLVLLNQYNFLVQQEAKTASARSIEN